MVRVATWFGWALIGGAAALICTMGACSEESASDRDDTPTTSNGGFAASGGSLSTTNTSSSSTSIGGAAAGGAAATGGGGQSAAVDYCAECGTPTESGSIASGAIDEASGIGASRVHDGIFYLHNDSGDSARFFAVDAAGADQGRFNVGNATAVDWEDLAVGPCGAAGSCVYLGDTGDNDAARNDYVVYRVAEPSAVGQGAQDVTTERLEFEYPDGSHNCETLLVHPLTGEIALVTKEASGPGGVYRFPTPLEVGEQVTLEKVGEVTPPDGSNLFTGGDVHPAGLGVLLRTNTHVWFYSMAADETVAMALARQPCSLPVGEEAQGEAIAWVPTGDGYFTVSEGANATLYEVSCGEG